MGPPFTMSSHGGGHRGPPPSSPPSPAAGPTPLSGPVPPCSLGRSPFGLSLGVSGLPTTRLGTSPYPGHDNYTPPSTVLRTLH